MNENTLLAIVIASGIASCTSCAITDRIIASNERIVMTPQQICVSNAWTQADRLACLQEQAK